MDIILFKNLFLLADNFFSILCWLLPYNKMNKSQIQICSLPPEPPPDFPPHPTPLGCHRALGWAPCVGTAAFHQLSILHMVMYIYPCYFFQFVQPSPTHTISKVCSLCLHHYSCPANRFISVIFLDSVYIC